MILALNASSNSSNSQEVRDSEAIMNGCYPPKAWVGGRMTSLFVVMFDVKTIRKLHRKTCFEPSAFGMLCVQKESCASCSREPDWQQEQEVRKDFKRL